MIYICLTSLLPVAVKRNQPKLHIREREKGAGDRKNIRKQISKEIEFIFMLWLGYIMQMVKPVPYS